jgi:hypothetical protein
MKKKKAKKRKTKSRAKLKARRKANVLTKKERKEVQNMFRESLTFD